MLIGREASLNKTFIAAFGIAIVSGGLAMAQTTGTEPILEALAKARNRRAQGEAGVLVVKVGSGIHRLGKAMELTTEDHDLVFVGEKGSVVSGGVELPPFVDAGGVWKTHVPAGMRFEQAFVNGRLAIRAREPDEGWYYLRGPVGGKRDLSHEAFFCDRRNTAELNALGQDEVAYVYVRIYQMWVQGIHRVGSFDAASDVVTFSPKTEMSVFGWDPYALRYTVENFRSALDSPGEWFHDRKTGEFLYIPRPDEDIRKARAVVPAVDCLLKLSCRNVTFRGIRFTACGYDTSAGVAGCQAQPQSAASIRIEHATGVLFDACQVDCVGGTAIRVGDGCRDVSFVRSFIEQFGVGGIYIGGDKKDVPSGVKIDNNLIRSGGIVLAGGIGVWIGYAKDVDVTHNEICDLRYSGISSGWTWGYAPTPNSGIRINYNYIHDIGYGILSDMGGIYTLGDHHGSEVIGNRIHDVWSNDTSGRGAWGLYADEGTSNVRFESNLVYRTKTGSIHQHYGKNNIWRNNIFAYAQEYPVEHTRVEPHHSFDFVNNIVVWTNDTKGVRLARQIAGGIPASNVVDVTFDRNVYWTPNGGITNSFHNADFATWQRLGLDVGGTVADPQLENPATGHWMPRVGSVAYSLGFRRFNPFDAGPYGEEGCLAAWTESKPLVLPPLVLPPKPPRILCDAYRTGFEGYPDSTPPPLFLVSCKLGQSKKGGLQITDKEAFTGQHSLAFRDAADLQARYQPHLVAYFGATSGVVRLRFAMKGDAKSAFSCVMRDHESLGAFSFSNGPDISYWNGGVYGAGRKIVDVPPDKWFKIALTLALTDKSPTWRFEVDPCDGRVPVVIDGLPCKDLAFRHPDWIGWISDAATDSVVFIDDLDFSVGNK